MSTPTDAHLDELAAVCGMDAASFVAAWDRSRLPYDCGEVTAAEYWLQFGVDDEPTLERALAADAAAWSVPNHALVEWLGRLREAGLRTAILSNMPREQWLRLGPLYEDRLRGCDEITLSFEVGVAKPDERIYRHCLERLGVAPEDALFVDDRAENVEGAWALGLAAIRYGGLDAFRAELAERFVDAIPLPTAPAATPA